MATFATGSLTIPKQKIEPWLGKIKGGSVVASLSTPVPMTFGEGESWTFDIGEAEYVAEGAQKGQSTVTPTTKTIKPHKFHKTLRFNEEVLWADEDRRLEVVDEILDLIQPALSRALDFGVFHEINPTGGAVVAAMNGGLTDTTNLVEYVAADKPYVSLDAADALVLADGFVPRDIALDPKYAAKFSAYRNGTTARYKVLQNLLQPWHKLWLLTGTPCPNSPLDAWALTRLMNPNNVPQYFGQWKRQTMMQLSQYKWVPKAGSHEMAFQAMQPAIRFKKSECLDLPPVTYENRKCDITIPQLNALKEMKKEAATLLANGVQITAANAADKIGKMRQILCGAVKDKDTGIYHVLDYAPRLSLLMECIEQASAKVLVIVPFKGILYHLKEDIEKAWHADSRGWECDFVNGDVTPKQRAEKFRWFKTTPEAKLLLCHPKVMAHGITATEADMLIFYAPIYSNEESQQVMERINRPGQTRKMTIIRMAASNVEWNIYNQVEGKRLTQESILEMYKKELLAL